MGTPLLIHQPPYSLLNRWVESDLLDALGEGGVGCIPSVQQLEDSLAATRNLTFTAEELAAIDEHAVESGINLWAQSSAN